MNTAAPTPATAMEVRGVKTMRIMNDGCDEVGGSRTGCHCLDTISLSVEISLRRRVPFSTAPHPIVWSVQVP
jgi:hypothetical protein